MKRIKVVKDNTLRVFIHFTKITRSLSCSFPLKLSISSQLYDFRLGRSSPNDTII